MSLFERDAEVNVQRIQLSVKRLCFFLLLVFHSALSLAAAPAEEKVVLAPLHVSWEKSIPPRIVGLLGKPPVKLTERSSISIERKKFPAERTILFFLPESESAAPFTLEVEDSTNQVKIQKKDIQPIGTREIWFWGVTPVSRCDGMSSFHFRLLNQLRTYENGSGLFVWHWKKEELPQQALLYTLPSYSVDTPKEIKSTGWKPSSRKEDWLRCRRHHGGECPFVFSIDTNRFGQRNQVKFRGHQKRNFEAHECPI